MPSNLPHWPGASGAYSRAYRILTNMGLRGHVTENWWRGKRTVTASQEMEDFIDALNRGNENDIKAYNLLYAEYDLPR